MKKIHVELKSLRPYLQHRRPSSEEEVKETKKITDVLRKNQFDPDAAKKEANFGVYKDENGYYIPMEHIQESMIKAATNFKLGGAGGKKTYKDAVRSNVFPELDKIPMQTKEFEIDARYVKIQRNGIRRYRPMFMEWTASFNLLVLDDTLPTEILKEIIELAGTVVGIGDYRPKYGLFTVEKFEEKKGKKE